MPSPALALLMPSSSKGGGGASEAKPDLKSEATAAVMEAVETKDVEALKSALTSFYDACAMGDED
jgi:hypothetical protein